MKNRNNFDFNIDEFDDIMDILPIRNVSHRSQSKRSEIHKKQAGIKSIERSSDELRDEFANEEVLNFTYHASMHEYEWLLDSLGSFYNSQWIEDILRLLKGGKEASVYQCRANEAINSNQEYIAAKVYRPRRFRNLRNDHIYREGRARLDQDGHVIHDDRMNHAMNKRTEFGRKLMHTSWIEHEFQTMQIFYQAGVDIPQPYARGNNAILMEYIGWQDIPAPTLNSINLGKVEAQSIFDQVIKNVNIMLSVKRVHGDLSAFNILYYDGKIKLIDFPQSINPLQNRNSYLIFRRDIYQVCRYFIRQGVEIQPDALAHDLWISHGYPISPDVNPGLLGDQDEDNYSYWKDAQIP